MKKKFFEWSLSAILLGWYLMVPPRFVPDDSSLPVQVLDEAPLREWEIVGSADTVNECDTQRVQMLQMPPVGKEFHLGWNRANSLRLMDSLCIGTDDHRLK